MASLLDWLVMCSENDEFVSNFNRLNNARLSFRPRPVAPIVAMVDRACGYSHENVPAEERAFVRFCVDVWRRIPRTEAQGRVT